MTPRRPLTEEEKAKKREYYRKNRDKILEYQRSDEYKENRNKRIRESESRKAYQKEFQPEYQAKYQESPENRKKRCDAVLKYEERNPEKVKAYRQKWWQEHKDEQRERRTEYMREYRARKKAEKEGKKDSSDT